MACVTLKRPFPDSSPVLHPLQHAEHQQNVEMDGDAAMGASAAASSVPLAKRRRMMLATPRSRPVRDIIRARERSRERELFQARRRSSAAGYGSVSLSGGFPNSYVAPTSCGSLLSRPMAPSPSMFQETPLSPSEIAVNLRDELKRLRRRKQIQKPGSPSRSPEPMMDDTSAFRAASQALNRAPSTASAAASPLSNKKDKPIFTLRQMSAIVERMCQERTEKVREEYDEILQRRLGEQYDAFVKFIDHQIEQRFSQAAAPSYLS